MTQPSIAPPRAVTRNLFAAGFVLAGFLAAALIWAMSAQIATTLRVPGAISADAPSHAVQHLAGGRVAVVNVALHQDVAEGAVLFEMDMAETRLRIAALEDSAALLGAELAEARRRLAAPDVTALPPGPVHPVGDAFALQDAELRGRIATQDAAAEAAAGQLAILRGQTTLQGELLGVVEARLAKTGDLQARGLATQTVMEELQQRALQLRVSDRASDARIADLEARIAAARAEADLIRQARRQALGTLALENMRSLARIEADLSLLRLQVEGAEVRAPVSGQVTELPVTVAGRVVRAGETLAVIAQPLDAPGIDVKIPARLADQVHPGQEGLLTIESLPQRTAPILRVRLTDVAAEPVRDDKGNAAWYTGAAEILAEDVALARNTLGTRFQLAVGMPVSVALNGVKTTFWSYLTAPFTAMWAGAFED